MPKEKIAIISVLKPVNDTRAYEKMARTLSSNPSYEIHIFGLQSPTNNVQHENIILHPHGIQPKGLFRIFVRLSLFFKLLKLKPQLIICNTHELLIVTVLHKILFGSKISYDIQENYYFNLLYQGNHPKGLREFLALTVRLKEWILSPIFDHFLLAEKSYAQELLFVKNKNTVIENKAIIPENWSRKKSKSEKTRILFSGTITKSNGILRALSWMKNLSNESDRIEFVIIGHCPNSRIYDLLNASQYDFIENHISPTPLPHDRILAQIKKAHFGLVCYDLNPSNRNCIPTKVYEYLALGLPSIFEKDNAWDALIAKHQAGHCTNFDLSPDDDLFDLITNNALGKETTYVEEANWKQEGKQLKSIVHKILSVT